MNPWVTLAIAIMFEVLATSALKESQGMKQLIPTVLAYLGYGISFYFLALALKHIPLGMAYAIWSAAGIILLSLIGLIVYKQNIGLIEALGLLLIISGVTLTKLG